MPKIRVDSSLEMHYEDHDFTDPWRTAETVVLQHGNGKSGRFWYAWVPLLAAEYRVLRPDARGFGRSTVPPDGYPWSLGGFADELKGFMDALGLDKVHLIGETLGGSMCLQFAHWYPEKLKSLTVSSSPFRWTDAQYHFNAQEQAHKEGMQAFLRSSMHWRLDPERSDPQHIDWYAAEMAKTATSVALETMDYLAGEDLSGILPEIRVPTLILASEGSHATYPHRSEEARQLIPGSKLVVIPETAGYVQHTAPVQCVAAWKEFASALV